MPEPLDYRPPQQDAMGDMSIEHEPHLRPIHFGDANDPPLAADPSVGKAPADGDDDARLLHTVWDEPALSRDLAGAPAEHEVTYSRWLTQRIAETSRFRSWTAVILIALASGPWAVLGAFWGSGQSIFSVLVLVSIAPAVEELMKASAALYVAEKRPYLFRHPLQILLCGLCAGVSFAAIENVIYLYIYIPDAPAELWLWRWTVCVALHATCAMIGAVGVIRVWRDAHARQSLPQTTLAAPWLFAATIVHGLYNAAALFLERFDVLPWTP